jgi:hypothetical protein
MAMPASLAIQIRPVQKAHVSTREHLNARQINTFGMENARMIHWITVANMGINVSRLWKAGTVAIVSRGYVKPRNARAVTASVVVHV